MELNIDSVNLAEKTFTFSYNFEPETTVALRNTSTLNISKFEKKILVYPNPTNSILNIQLKDGATIE